MKQYLLVIPGQLPGLNEYTKATRSNKYGGAGMKRQAEHVVQHAIMSSMHGIRVKSPVRIQYTWYEPNRKRDKDNIAFAKKFIQDALVKNRVLRNDGWNDIDGFSDDFRVDKKRPRVEVRIEEIGEELNHGDAADV